MAFNPDFTLLEQQYQERIDWAINTLGKTVTLYFKKDPVEQNIPEDIIDEIRGDSIKQPFYKPNGQIIEYDTSTLKALIKHNPTDFKRFDLKINDSTNVIRLKTFMTNCPDLIKCEYIVADEVSKNYVYTKYKLLREPTIHGLKSDRYCISFWERVL